MGWRVTRRIAHIERNWLYFLGFGAPFTLATFYCSTFVGAAIFQTLFPVVRAALRPLRCASVRSLILTPPPRPLHTQTAPFAPTHAACQYIVIASDSRARNSDGDGSAAEPLGRPLPVFRCGLRRAGAPLPRSPSARRRGKRCSPLSLSLSLSFSRPSHTVRTTEKNLAQSAADNGAADPALRMSAAALSARVSRSASGVRERRGLAGGRRDRAVALAGAR
jgi:hypothetical protein